MRIIRCSTAERPEPAFAAVEGDGPDAVVRSLDVTRAADLVGAEPGAEVGAYADVTLHPPTEPRLIVCAGGNYRTQLAEIGKPVPTTPMVFLKGLNTLAAHGDPIDAPDDVERLEYEGELTVVVGRTMRDVAVEDALSHVLGYTVANDVTASDHRADGQWTRAKSLDTFCPVGPWIETGIDDPMALHVRTTRNGEVVQDCGTDDMVFGVAELLSWTSRHLTLVPGDLLLTASPGGVGPMAPGDEVTVDVSGVGTLTNRVRRREPGHVPAASVLGT